MDSAYVEALLSKRIAFAKQLREDLETSNSVAQLTLELYSTILDGKSTLQACIHFSFQD